METGNEAFDKTFNETYKTKKDGNWDIVRKHDLGRQQPLDTPRMVASHVPVVYSLHDPRGLTSLRIRLLHNLSCS